MKYGYARVSSDTQDYQAQVEALKAAGCERIRSEKASGKSSNGRPSFQAAEGALPGDAVVVLSSTVSPDHHAPAQRHRRPQGPAVARIARRQLVRHEHRHRPPRARIMGGIAEFEREPMRKRCQAGIERAKVKGTKFGRPPALHAGQRRKIAERYAAGETMAVLARDYECGEATIWRALQG